MYNVECGDRFGFSRLLCFRIRIFKCSRLMGLFNWVSFRVVAAAAMAQGSLRATASNGSSSTMAQGSVSDHQVSFQIDAKRR